MVVMAAAWTATRGKVTRSERGSPYAEGNAPLSGMRTTNPNCRFDSCPPSREEPRSRFNSGQLSQSGRLNGFETGESSGPCSVAESLPRHAARPGPIGQGWRQTRAGATDRPSVRRAGCDPRPPRWEDRGERRTRRRTDFALHGRRIRQDHGWIGGLQQERPGMARHPDNARRTHRDSETRADPPSWTSNGRGIRSSEHRLIHKLIDTQANSGKM
jgi:hypothetical protein